MPIVKDCIEGRHKDVNPSVNLLPQGTIIQMDSINIMSRKKGKNKKLFFLIATSRTARASYLINLETGDFLYSDELVSDTEYQIVSNAEIRIHGSID